MFNWKKAITLIAASATLYSTFTVLPNGARADSQSAASFYVAPGGNDTNPGTSNAPFATLEAARNAIRTLKQSAGGLPQGGVTVYLREGEYARKSAFQLKAEDSGTPAAPIVYQALKRRRLRGRLKSTLRKRRQLRTRTL